MGMVNPGSSVSSLSQTTLTVTVAGPVIPSLSRGEVRTRLAVPSLVSILMGLFSVSLRDRLISLPTSPEILSLLNFSKTRKTWFPHMAKV